MIATRTNDVGAWERAEIARSASEGERLRHAIYATGAHTLQRYADPPADSPYPLEYAFHLVGDVRGKDVLDIGCGSGADSAILAARGAHVLSMDISPVLLDLARDRLTHDGRVEQMTPLCGSAHAIPLPDSSVDLVFGDAILHHLDLLRVRGEVHRVLRPGGRAIFKEPVRESRLLMWLRRLIPVRTPDVSPFERPLRWAELDLIASAFSGSRRRYFQLPPATVALRFGAPPWLCERILAWDRAVLHRYPAMRRFAAIVVLEVRK
jgi:SAM-dependent methyltransferase